jgi:hypothetical protein
MYTLASTTAALDPLLVRRLTTQDVLRGSTIYNAMVARALITDNRPRLARTLVDNLLDDANPAAEVQLVAGDLAQLENAVPRARRYYESALASVDAPGWLTRMARTRIAAIDDAG